jgi:hypothetical protein
MNQSSDADHVGQRSPFGGLAIEAATIADLRRAVSERDPEPLSRFDEKGADRFSQVDMLVRIDMTGTMAHQVVEHIHLSGYFIADGGPIVQRHHIIERDPLS